MFKATKRAAYHFLAFGWLMCVIPHLAFGAELNMQSFKIGLPNYTLRFSLPQEVVQQMSSWQVEKKVDFADPAFFRDGIRDLARHNHHFDGPLWAGTYGWLEFSLSVVRPLADYTGDITTLQGLDSYIRWWTREKNPDYGFQFDLWTGAGDRVWLRRWKNTLSQSHTLDHEEKIDVQIICVPLNKVMFFQATFRISESVPGSLKKWGAQAEAFRAAIASSMVLEPKGPDTGSR